MKGLMQEFKAFLIKGNVVDMAVGFIFGAAFAGVVKSFVNNVIMPPIGLLLGRVDFSKLFISLDGNTYNTLKEAEDASAPIIKYGVFINELITFIILGFVIFVAIKAINNMQRKNEEEKEEEKPKEKPEDIKLLEEIRDLLKK